VLASLLACGVLVAPLATATPLPPSPINPLPGSSFQGGDGNQDNAPPSIDWQGLEAAERVHDSPDPNAQDNAFVGGSKENLPLNPEGTLWDFTTEAGGVDPSKSNILDAWSTFDPQGGQAFLYLGFAREGVLGTTFATFELNHDPRQWNNGLATIPCRRTGDVLVSYEAQGGRNVDVIVQRWTTVLTDAATGYAKTGTLADFTSFVPNVDVQGAINEGEIVSYLPGFYGSAIPSPRLRRGSVERRPAPRNRARRPVCLIRLVLDAHALLDGALTEGRLVEPSGLRRAARAHRANLRGLGDEVPRRQCQRSSRPG
jgi:hypothetical protein